MQLQRFINKCQFHIRGIRIGAANAFTGILCAFVCWVLPYDMLRLAKIQNDMESFYFWLGVLVLSFPFGLFVNLVIGINWGYWND